MLRKVLVLYGGVSPEHEVSVITALQTMHALKEAGFNVLPGYIDKAGNWYLGNNNFFKPESYRNLEKLIDSAQELQVLPRRHHPVQIKINLGRTKPVEVDAIFPVFHGNNGEDGSIQGLLQLTNLPQMGCRLITSATGMDKFISKRVAQGIGLKTNPDVLITKTQWQVNKREYLQKIKSLGSDLYIKPNSLGSSIGLQRVVKLDQLENAIEVALAYDERVLVEKALTNVTEVNISILGNDPYRLSATEQPISSGDTLSFEDKYLRHGTQEGKVTGMASAKRLIPAPVNKHLITGIEFAAQELFRAMGGKGLARIDFMIDAKNTIIFNEINTIPGSLAFYLWDKTTISFPQLVQQLYDLAIEDWHTRQHVVTTFSSNILSHYQASGTKGSKT